MSSLEPLPEMDFKLPHPGFLLLNVIEDQIVRDDIRKMDKYWVRKRLRGHDNFKPQRNSEHWYEHFYTNVMLICKGPLLLWLARISAGFDQFLSWQSNKN